MYNEEIKEKFLSSYDRGTQGAYRNILNKAEPEEIRLSTDLYDFSLEDIKRVLYNIAPQTINSSATAGSVILTYINWAITNGLRNSNINPLVGLDEEFYMQFVQNLKLYYSEDEIIWLEEHLVNYQDIVIIRLLFEGVHTEELLNLTKHDVDFNDNILRLKNGDQVRTLKVSDRALKFIKGAIEQEKYYFKNGMINEDAKRSEGDLVQSEYVLRKSYTNVKDKVIDKVDYHIISHRLIVIKELFDYHILTPIKITQSGMIKMGKDLLLRDGKLGKGQYKEIAERFNRYITTDGYSRLSELKKIVNVDNIKELYPDVILQS